MKKQVEAWISFAEKDLLTVSEVIERSELTNIGNYSVDPLNSACLSKILQNYYIYI